MRTRHVAALAGRFIALAAAGAFLLAGTAGRAADTDILITEIMQNPAILLDDVGEWFEIHNTGATPVNLDGWTIKDLGYDTHVIASGGTAIVPAGGYAVLGRNAASMATQGVTLLYQYGTAFTLGNADDEVILLNASAVEIDRVVYDGGIVWPDPTGASMMWDELGAENNDGTHWATSTVVFGGGDKGTPGAPNGSVPAQPPVVTNVYHRPLLPVEDEEVTVYADVTDLDGLVSSVTLHLSYNGGAWSTAAMTLASGATYAGTIQGAADTDQIDYYVTALDDDGLSGANPSDAPTSFYSYTVNPELITPIATIHADSAGYDGTLVMVQGQVFIPGDYKADGVSVSGYIQDASGRGLNVFGTTRVTGQTLLNSTGNVVKVSGYVDYYFTTLEIVSYEVELVSGGNPALTPTALTTAAAADPGNEGTYIASLGPIVSIATTTGDNPAHNFTIDDGSGPLVIRVDDDLAPGLETWLVGDELEAAGAGATYAGQGQIIVGLATDIVNNGQGPDTTPPVLLSAVLTDPTSVTATFDEALDPVTSQVAGNYTVYQTAVPANTIAVTSAVLQPGNAAVVLTLAASAAGVDHSLKVNNVKDDSGNTIAPNSTVAIFELGEGDIVINEIMKDPLVIDDTLGEWFEVYNRGDSAVDMNGWTIKDLGLESHVIANGGPLVIGPGEYKVFARNAAAMALEGVTVFYQYAGFQLANADDEIVLLDTSLLEVDGVSYDDGLTWPDPTGSSMQWSGSGDNADGATWSQNGPVFGSGDRGTPGAPNDWLSPAPPPAAVTALGGVYPNPFNPKAVFDFTLARDERVTLAVFDVRGRLVRTVADAALPAGQYRGAYGWDGTDAQGRPVTSGTYFLRMRTASGFAQATKMVLVR